MAKLLRAILLGFREHLEGLEDKLRDYKTAVSDPKLYDEKVTNNWT